MQLNQLVKHAQLVQINVLHLLQVNVYQDIIWILHAKHVLTELINVLHQQQLNVYLDTIYLEFYVMHVQEMLQHVHLLQQ